MYKGVSLANDSVTYGDKDAAAVRQLARKGGVPECYARKVNIGKVNLESVRAWATERLAQLTGIEDDVVVEYVMSMLDSAEDLTPDPCKLHVAIQGFLGDQTPEFMRDLWALLLEAQDAVGGLAPSLVEAKKAELRAAAQRNSDMVGSARPGFDRRHGGLGPRWRERRTPQDPFDRRAGTESSSRRRPGRNQFTDKNGTVTTRTSDSGWGPRATHSQVIDSRSTPHDLETRQSTADRPGDPPRRRLNEWGQRSPHRDERYRSPHRDERYRSPHRDERYRSPHRDERYRSPRYEDEYLCGRSHEHEQDRSPRSVQRMYRRSKDRDEQDRPSRSNRSHRSHRREERRERDQYDPSYSHSPRHSERKRDDLSYSHHSSRSSHRPRHSHRHHSSSHDRDRSPVPKRRSLSRSPTHNHSCRFMARSSTPEYRDGHSRSPTPVYTRER